MCDCDGIEMEKKTYSYCININCVRVYNFFFTFVSFNGFYEEIFVRINLALANSCNSKRYQIMHNIEEKEERIEVFFLTRNELMIINYFYCGKRNYRHS